jgi:ubiquinone biosynthesis protein COQ9
MRNLSTKSEATHPKEEESESNVEKEEKMKPFPDQKGCQGLQRRRLLEAALLRHVPEYGWTDDAIVAAAADVVGNEGSSLAAIAGWISPDDLIAFSMDHWNEQWCAELEKEAPAGDRQVDRIVDALKRRLKYLQPYVQSRRWHEGMALGLRNPPRTQGQLKELVSIAVDSTSNPPLVDDFQPVSWTEQLGLGAVYVAVELHMLTDKSDDFQDTWDFLQHCIEEWDKLRRLETAPVFQTALTSAIAAIPSASAVSRQKIEEVASSVGDTLYAGTHIASALANGAFSLMMYTPAPSKDEQRDGSRPSHYEPTSVSK